MNAHVIVVAAVALMDGQGRMITVRKRGTTRFMNPGGKPEPGETPLDAAVREIAEELGVMLDPQALTELGVWSANAANEPDTIVTAHAFAAVLPPGAMPEPQAEIVELRRVLPHDVAARGDHALAEFAPLLVEHFVPTLLGDAT